MLFSLVLAVLVAAAPARAAGTCPWSGVRSAHATLTTVSVNDELYVVRGLAARTAFEQTLLDCGAPEAAVHFREWRRMRRWTNVCIVAGFPSVGLFWVGAALTGLTAATHKLDMIEDLTHPPPGRLPPR